MWFPAVILLSLAGHAAVAQEQKPLGVALHHDDTTPQLGTCEQTYGKGWVQCGSKSNAHCYNPSLGQSCCEIDSGFCDRGAYCAPVAGYCCLNSEDVAACARNAGFELPATSTAAVERPSTGAFTSTAQYIGKTLGSSSVEFEPSTEIPTRQANADSTSTNSLTVQISGARTERRTLAWTGFGICAVGLFMFSC
ncbi:hypothetical protein B0T24DRAFT_14316 [Lasiosphaeria ovina]|uniref:GPI anchored protein n=1 Tax=Lasiosphaeria ovina TaxID=92902 RepID=A0AAE0NJ85_9PEZI|nr:hypothetical protein B0T24DRAFT_14316 [Lasiosphaeria ovina]